MKRLLPLLLLLAVLPARADQRGTGDLGVVVERASGQLLVIEHSTDSRLAQIDGLGDLSHASVVFSRDERYAYVFGRDGGLFPVGVLPLVLSKPPANRSSLRSH